MRFTIRDLLWLLVVVALCLALYRQYSIYESSYRRLRIGSGMMNMAVHETVSKEEYDTIQEKFHEMWRPYIIKELGRESDSEGITPSEISRP